MRSLLPRVLISCALASSTIALPIGDEPAEAIPPWIRCENGRIRRTLLPIDIHFGEGVQGSGPNSTDHREGANIAIYNWAGNTPIRFDNSANDLTWRRIPVGPGGPIAQHFPISVVQSSCSLIDSRIDFNATYTNSYGPNRVAGTAAHELGHRVGLWHDPSSANCNPDTIMLPGGAQVWNSNCQWTGPRSIDIYITVDEYGP